MCFDGLNHEGSCERVTELRHSCSSPKLSFSVQNLLPACKGISIWFFFWVPKDREETYHESTRIRNCYECFILTFYQVDSLQFRVEGNFMCAKFCAGHRLNNVEQHQVLSTRNSGGSGDKETIMQQEIRVSRWLEGSNADKRYIPPLLEGWKKAPRIHQRCAWKKEVKGAGDRGRMLSSGGKDPPHVRIHHILEATGNLT
jgi:hypothetical protein